MDLYEIIIHQNPPWSSGVIICFTVLLCLFSLGLGLLIGMKKLKPTQGITILLIYIFLFVVFASTVFTRRPTPEARYELQLFWSYRYVVENHSRAMLEEILLNCALLMPLGILLPFAMDRVKGVWFPLLTGLLVSSCIEICQLVFHLGLFEWDDMIHNTLGCVIGYVIVGKIYGKFMSFKQGK